MGTTDNGTVDLTLMEPVFEKYRARQGALIPILQKAQGIYGYLPKEVLELISGQLKVSLAKIYGVATFYAQFYLEPRGKHILHICDGTACHVKGSPRLVDAIEEEFGIGPGETTDDYELTTEVVYCLGSCALAPIAVLDNQVLGGVRKDALVKRVKKVMERDRETVEG